VAGRTMEEMRMVGAALVADTMVSRSRLVIFND
jgi:hypothetical protein